MYRSLQVCLVIVTFTFAACYSEPGSNEITTTPSPQPATLAPSPPESPTPTITLPQIPTPNNSDLMVLMERAVCSRACPIYRLTIEGDGNVTYEGIWNVRVEGIHKAWINSQKIRELIAAIEDADFFSLEDRYYAGVDLPSVNLAITLNGRSKSVWRQSSGCSNTFGEPPPEVCELENLIDAITNSSQWVS